MFESQSFDDHDTPKNIDPEVFSQEAEEERRQAHFRDYLLAPLIAGRNQSLGNQSRIRAEDVSNTGEHVEIANVRTTEESQSPQHKGGTVSVERDANGEISRIYVECTCGDKIMLDFETDEPAEVPAIESEEEIIAEETLDGSDESEKRITRGGVDQDRVIN